MKFLTVSRCLHSTLLGRLKVDADMTITIVIGDIDTIHIEFITELLQDCIGRKHELNVPHFQFAGEIVEYASANEVDLFVLFLNNILFRSSNAPVESRMRQVMRLVWDLKTKHERPIIGICGIDTYEDFASIAGVDYFFTVPFNPREFSTAVQECLPWSDLLGHGPIGNA